MLQTPTSNTSSDNGVISVVNAPAVGVGSALSGAVHQALCESAGNALFSLDSSLHVFDKESIALFLKAQLSRRKHPQLKLRQ